MQTSQALIDEGNTLIRRAQEELIVIAVQVAVEMRQLVRREIGLVGWFIPLVLCDCQSAAIAHSIIPLQRYIP